MAQMCLGRVYVYESQSVCQLCVETPHVLPSV